jgi:putative redox protein
MHFSIEAAGSAVEADARPPIGEGKAMSPKELLLSALASCTAMDVVALLNKHRQKPDSFSITAEGSLSEGGHPKVFTGAKLVFEVTGTVDPQILIDSVRASQTRFCGVSAMLSRAFPIAYEILVNGVLVGSGEAKFDA